MAVYAGEAKRRRTTLLAAIAAAVVGLIIGVVVGHATAPSLNDKIADGRNGGRDLVTALKVLPLEYSQALSGSEGTTLIGDTVDRVTAQLKDALDGAPWLGPQQRTAATTAVQSVKTAATGKVPAAEFSKTVDAASTTLDGVFGLPASP